MKNQYISLCHCGRDRHWQAVNFPEEFLPRGIRAMKYSLSREADWNFERADRTLVDIRELAELVP